MQQNGQSYQWTLGVMNSKVRRPHDIERVHVSHFVPQLNADDATKTPIARTHRSSCGIFNKRRRPSLEIYPAGQDILDAIVVTWVYVETRRRTHEKDAQLF
jgi:hypothetical protein